MLLDKLVEVVNEFRDFWWKDVVIESVERENEIYKLRIRENFILRIVVGIKIKNGWTWYAIS